jgi:hypothetical protein
MQTAFLRFWDGERHQGAFYLFSKERYNRSRF